MRPFKAAFSVGIGCCVAGVVAGQAAAQTTASTGQGGGAVVTQPGDAALDQVKALKTFVYAVDSTLDFVSGESLPGNVMRGAPYSGEGLTTVTQTLADGTRIERDTTAKLYRDSEGRTRREQTLLGLGALNPSGEAPMSITIVDPVAGVSYILEPNSRKARRVPMVQKDGRGLPPPPPPPPPQPVPGAGFGSGQVVIMGKGPGSPANLQSPPTTESLGNSKMEGLDVVGQRITSRIEAGRIGNDRPIDIVDERWEAPALGVLMSSRHHDPRTGDVEYRLTNISRAEPSSDLFTVPSDYTIVDVRDDNDNAFFRRIVRDPNAQPKKPQ